MDDTYCSSDSVYILLDTEYNHEHIHHRHRVLSEKKEREGGVDREGKIKLLES